MPSKPAPPPGYAYIRVVREDLYLVPLHSVGSRPELVTKINGWTMRQVVRDWFGPGRSLDYTHATRDAYRLSGSARVLSLQEIYPDSQPAVKETRA